ncbi:hypothetical protein EA462_08460 [Natrarchaeobius halalkaliphilus]|uniref:Uncharacterized protein n=1 Tax=Natrarchaeobius halalkaliphilus TaxID=1679091 RepID=A0A3N6LM37_9EURY|nr:hypothetical protein [Natrarchaeobius halalkaliphilus]RQG90028.1 hypothetical protein EA462_08460 [Natrarchaeobius halalkaliphilus]
MANRDDVTRELARCTECGSVYAARQWPGGTIQPIGAGNCDCGSTNFVLVTDAGEDPSTGGVNAE